ncbi:M23 family metallopeptidase [Kordia sp. YSTF-M3]|uniref:M23 family metallopeptidase n=1 Tax=Kordia aestuariivivens TaxID=2759037 RepID=A0ABR7QGH9_9FLAO|nr:M23 family metallopeptidase [Kordia aestuariivivens]MBC8757675.1 M23 family metallopeptidase [Kordia aestuariivivens]
MRNLFFFLLLSFSVCNAQHVSIKRDSISSTKDTIFLSVKNNMLSPMFLKIIPIDSTSRSIVYTKNTVLQPSEKLIGFMKVPRNILETDTSKINLSNYFSFKAGYGDPSTVKHNNTYQYLLPYKKRRKLIQGNFGKFSHDHIASNHAFDFGTQIGDTLYAAREGKVVMLKEDSKKHGRTRKYINDGNYIIIQHDDGTTASYYHLDFKGALVEKGDLVQRGQVIGISGMTGFTTVPHVHFVVHKATVDNGNVSVPIQFEGYIGKKFKKGKRYARKK